jgi:hypothetical protein
MAAGPFTFFDLAKPKISGTIDLSSDAFHGVLTTSSQSLDATFAGTSTNCQYSDLTAEVPNGSGYTTGGRLLSTVTWNQSAGTVTFDCDDLSWPSSTFTAQYLVLADWTATNKDLLCFSDLGGVSPVAGTLTVVISGSGVFTLT